MKMNPVEALCWSVALPGFGQLRNKKYIKGLLLIALEVLINTGSNLNTVIKSSFQGEIVGAIGQANYQWLMFYPCVYMFGIWDAFRDAGGGGESAYSFIPFVGGAYFGTVGVIGSDRLTLFGTLLGPVWMGLLFAFGGIALGWACKTILDNKRNVLGGNTR